MDSYKKAPAGFIQLVENKYDVKIIDSHYIMVDSKFKKYNMMLDVQFNDTLARRFQEKYGSVTSAMHVAWEHRQDSIRFYAEIGNNILLLWDSACE